MEELENKYIELLLKRCLKFEKSKSLFINYDIVNKNFVDKVKKMAKEMGIEDIGEDAFDINVKHDKLKNISLDDIETDPFFNKSKWDEYAKKDASFLMLKTEFPHAMDDIDADKVAKANKVMSSTRKDFIQKEISYQIPWCIAVLPNEVWAKELFGDNKDSYDKLYKTILDVCMVDENSPIDNWNKFMIDIGARSKKLTSLKIKKMHYKNSLGTNLTVELPENAIWNSAASESKNGVIVNMPSYEVFTTPHYLKTEGIVYSSRPLVYAGGIVDEFYIEFKNGKVTNYDAKIGKEILKGIIEADDNSCYLGEVALVNDDSKISNTKIVFGITLLDENASCHVALGNGFPASIENGLNMSREELQKHGINHSLHHVDFMIGTPDLEITAETEDGKTTTLFKDGNFSI